MHVLFVILNKNMDWLIIILTLLAMRGEKKTNKEKEIRKNKKIAIIIILQFHSITTTEYFHGKTQAITLTMIGNKSTYLRFINKETILI